MDIDNSSDFALKEYLGSRKFQFVADAVGLPIDQINFLFAQILALIVAYLFRVVLHPSNVSVASRHWTALSAGLCISYFCFGKQVLLAIVLVVMCYFLLILLPPAIFHHTTLCASITFLSAIHIHRQFYEDALFVVDITGPLMIMVQKATSLAYSINDGIFKDPSKLTALQKNFLIKSKPTALEYFSYMLCFHSILAGPFFMFTDYQDFIEGNQFIRYEALKKTTQSKSINHETLNNNQITGNNNLQTTSPLITSADKELCAGKYCDVTTCEEPDPTEAALSKVLTAFVCALTVAAVLPIFPSRHLMEPTFLTSSLLYKVVYILMATTIARQLYYTAWFLADAVCSLSGLGFSGFDENGKSKWDLVSNVDIIGVEFGTTLKTTLDSWNIGTMKWLRFLVYERAPSQKTFLTYLLSSIWHGFYPGYYLTFLGGAFFTIVARVVRRSVRPRVLRLGIGVKRLYDFATFLTTRLCLSYVTFPFVLLRFWPSILVYNSLKYYLHSIGFVAMVVLPFALPSPTKDVSNSSEHPVGNAASTCLTESYPKTSQKHDTTVKKMQ